MSFAFKGKIFNRKCQDFMKMFAERNGKQIDLVITSPPYNTSGTDRRYDVYEDAMTDEQYIAQSVEWFELLDGCMNDDGVIVYNISYSCEKPDLMYLVIADIIRKTNWRVIETIPWKKSSAMPNTSHANRLTRICELVFVFCKKGHEDTFKCNKAVSSMRGDNAVYSSKLYNFIEAKNNDGPCELNGATYSTDFVKACLELYAVPGYVVYDPFMGSGTTAVACEEWGYDWVGTELSPQQIDYAYKRIEEVE